MSISREQAIHKLIGRFRVFSVSIPNDDPDERSYAPSDSDLAILSAVLGREITEKDLAFSTGPDGAYFWMPAKETVEKSEPLFYIQNKGYCGNSLLWWKSDRCGYTTDLSEALKLNYESARQLCRSRPDEDFAWPVDLIDSSSTRQISCESEAIRKNRPVVF